MTDDEKLEAARVQICIIRNAYLELAKIETPEGRGLIPCCTRVSVSENGQRIGILMDEEELTGLPPFHILSFTPDEADDFCKILVEYIEEAKKRRLKGDGT